MSTKFRFGLGAFLFMLLSFSTNAQGISEAREWNQFILEAIRNDFARPTVHARNLFHHSVIAYDAWAAYDPSKKRYFLGDTLNGYVCEFDGIDIPLDIQAARDETIAYASFRFIQNRYNNSPNYPQTYNLIYNYMVQEGYDVNNTSTQYATGGPAELGNYLAEQIQLYGYTDGSNEINDYGNTFYTQANPPIIMAQPGNPDIVDPNRWQPITLTEAIDQAGNPILSTPDHLSPEWGDVVPFSLDTTMYTELVRDGNTYKVYADTNAPALLNLLDSSDWDSFYKWNHTLVPIWQSHLDHTDGVMWDISPASIGNNTWYPSTEAEYQTFYDLLNGGDPGTGYALNPVTGMPYTPQIVPRGDYARVLAEFWADGIDSETPPGHWFEIYHYVTDQPTFERKWQGIGPDLDVLEYDVKAHLALGGAMHDAAICAWSLKGFYDYIRPVSAVRYMADQGQSSDENLASYDPNGIPLLPGYVELVEIGDPLAGQWNENVGKIKLFTWKGHEYISDPLTEVAGVGWILAENWWPYQRPTFVTPPFAGFVSGHSTFSRAGARIMEYMTGSEYFPGGLGEFQALQNDYLKFEDGPSMTITLQWASYRDAADQCSLSRLWGGIHPPIDDIPGRLIGEEVGALAFDYADSIYDQNCPALIETIISDSVLNISDIGSQFTMSFQFNVAMDTAQNASVSLLTPQLSTAVGLNDIYWVDSFNMVALFDVLNSTLEIYETRIELSNLMTGSGDALPDYILSDFFLVDTRRPELDGINANYTEITDAETGLNLTLDLDFSEICDTNFVPSIAFQSPGLVNPTLVFNPTLSAWISDTVYSAYYAISDFDETITDIEVEVDMVNDAYENTMTTALVQNVFIIDTENPLMVAVSSTDTLLTQSDLLSPQFTATITFSETMDIAVIPSISFYDQSALYGTVIQNLAQTSWIDSTNLSAEFFIFNNSNDLIALDLNCTGAVDSRGNSLGSTLFSNAIYSDMKSPEVTWTVSSVAYIADSSVTANDYYVDVNFSELMDTMVKPLVVHEASQNLTNTVQYNVPASYFLDSMNYRAIFQVLDENIEVNPVHLKVEYGRDFAGNLQTVYVDSGFIQIDTKNPEIIGLYANDYILDQINDPFDVVVLFNEAMLQSQTTSIVYNPAITLPLVLNLDNASWTNSTTYEFNHTYLSPPNQSTDFAIYLDSAVDVAGNKCIPLEVQDFFRVELPLGISENEFNQFNLYPTLLSNGDQLTLTLNTKMNISDLWLQLISPLGQQSQNIHFTGDGVLFQSDPINVAPGMYYLRKDNRQFKLIVTQ